MEAKELLEIMNEHFSKGFFDTFGEYDASTFNQELNEALCKKGVTDFEWVWDNGVSKFCIIPKYENWVIKIPFRGSYEEYERSYSCTNEDGEHYKDYETIEEFYDFTGASYTYDVDEWDYCAAEVAAYDHAKALGIEQYFAKTEFLGYMGGYPVYIQEKAEMFSARYSDGSSSRKSYTKEDKDKMRAKIDSLSDKSGNGRYPELPSTTWMLDFEFFYGEKALEKFFNGLLEMSIEDLHNGNIGYIDGYPKLVDYSSWDH